MHSNLGSEQGAHLQHQPLANDCHLLIGCFCMCRLHMKSVANQAMLSTDRRPSQQHLNLLILYVHVYCGRSELSELSLAVC